MPFKHQQGSFRAGGTWTCWCDAYTVEQAVEIVGTIRSAGFACRREKERVFVLAKDADARPCLLPDGDPNQIAKGKPHYYLRGHASGLAGEPAPPFPEGNAPWQDRLFHTGWCDGARARQRDERGTHD